MEVRGTNFSRYDAQHIAHVQREIAHSIKPNVLRQLEDDDLSEEVFQRLLEQDLVELSPEAKSLLKQMRDHRKGRTRRKGEERSPDFMALLAGLEEFRRTVEDLDRDDPLPKEAPKPFVPPMITLSNHVPRDPAVRTTISEPGGDSATDWRVGGGLSPAAELARKMIAYAPRNELKDTVARELEVFGKDVIAQVKQFGVRIVVLERHMALTDLRIKGMMVVSPSERTFDGRPWSQVRGLYDTSRRMLVVGEELVGLRDRSTSRHEFAHAYDHVFSEKNHRRLPLSVQLWNSFRQERGGLVSGYAATNPAEYFAESVEAFFQPGAREFLRSKDPLMFNYLAQLFAA